MGHHSAPRPWPQRQLVQRGAQLAAPHRHGVAHQVAQRQPRQRHGDRTPPPRHVSLDPRREPRGIAEGAEASRDRLGVCFRRIESRAVREPDGEALLAVRREAHPVLATALTERSIGTVVVDVAEVGRPRRGNGETGNRRVVDELSERRCVRDIPLQSHSYCRSGSNRTAVI